MRDMFKTRSHSWREAGLARQLNARAVRRARREVAVLVPLLVAVLVVYAHRRALFGPGFDTPARVITAVALVILGWAFARDAGRALGPQMFRRLEPGTAGIVGFLVRLATLAVAIVAALRIAGLDPRTLVAGGAFTAVILGLAGQQTLGNVIAGTVLLSARPFRVGERVRLQAGPLGGRIEGIVSSLGLLYTTMLQGDDTTMIPNSLVLSSAIMPVREPTAVDLRARLRPEITPSDLQRLFEEAVQVPTRAEPRIDVEEIDADEVVVRITAIPAIPADGPRLSDEVLAALAGVTRDARPAHSSVASAPAAQTPAR